MKQPAKLLFVACLTTLVAAAGSANTTAAETTASVQDLAQVSATDLVISASWAKLPEAYVLQLVLDRADPKPERATASLVAAAFPITSISREDLDRPGFSFCIGESFGSPRDMDPGMQCERELKLVDGQLVVQSKQHAQEMDSHVNQPYPPRHKDRRVEVWLLKSDGTQILPATYSRQTGPVFKSTGVKQEVEISYEFPMADSVQAVAAAIRIDDDFYIEKLQPAAQPASQ